MQCFTNDMNYQKIFQVILLISRFGLAALFLFTAGAKLWILRTFAASIGELLAAATIPPLRWMWPVTVAVISIEIVTGLFLLLPRAARVGALLAAVLLIGFSAFALYYVYVLHGEPLECGCFGRIIGSQLGLTTALRNLALLIPTFIVFFGYRKQSHSTVRGFEQVDVIV